MNVYHLSALLLGTASSLHCIGMCGPLIWMLPAGKDNYWLGRIAYHVGRLITYASLGGIVGIIGQGVSLTGYQQWLSIACGVMMILWFWIHPQAHIPFVSRFFNQYIRPKFQQFMNRPLGITSFFSMGMLNGLLPCGVVYGALAGALATGTVADASVFMVLFGLGTVPALLALSATKKMGIRIPHANKIARYGLLIAGVLLVLRGANLGIPYLSPEVVQDQYAKTVKMNCCKIPKETQTQP
jgi:sulfite exporter TauE/SafE